MPLKAKEEAEEEIQKAIENSAAATEGSVEQFVVLSELDGMKEEQRMTPTESFVLKLPGVYGLVNYFTIRVFSHWHLRYFIETSQLNIFSACLVVRLTG